MFNEAVISKILSTSMVFIAIIAAFCIVCFVIELCAGRGEGTSRWLSMIVVCAMICACCSVASNMLKDSDKSEEPKEDKAATVVPYEDSSTKDDMDVKPLDGYGIFDYN